MLALYIFSKKKITAKEKEPLDPALEKKFTRLYGSDADDMMSLYKSNTITNDTDLSNSVIVDNSASMLNLEHSNSEKLDENFSEQMEQDPQMREAFEKMLAEKRGTVKQFTIKKVDVNQIKEEILDEKL